MGSSALDVHRDSNMASERARTAFYMRRGGATYRVIGEHFGVRPERARQLVLAATREAIGRAPHLKETILDSIYLGDSSTRAGFPTVHSVRTSDRGNSLQSLGALRDGRASDRVFGRWVVTQRSCHC